MEKKPLKTPMGTGMGSTPRGQMPVQTPMVTTKTTGKPMVSRRQPTAAPTSAQPKPKFFGAVAKKVVNKVRAAKAQAGAKPQGNPMNPMGSGNPKRGMY